MFHIENNRIIVRQIGGNYHEDIDSSRTYGCYETLEEAREVLEDLKAFTDGYKEILRTSGLDTIIYETVSIVEEGADGFDTVIEYWDSLTDELRAAMRISEREYHDFLDYKRDEWRTVSEILEA